MARSQQVLDQARADLASLGVDEFVRRYRRQGWQHDELTRVLRKAGRKHNRIVPVQPPSSRRTRRGP